MPKPRTEPTKRAAKAAKAAAKADASAKVARDAGTRPAPAAATAPSATPKRTESPPVRAAATAADPVKAAEVISVFSELEEDFFRAGQTDTAAIPKQPSESFDDLDAGYQKQTFWSRLVGKKPKR